MNIDAITTVSAYGVLFLIYGFLSVMAFCVYGIDKLAAIKGWRRVNEFTLHGLALFGGWVGAFLAQRLFRHKTKKTRFQIVFWLTVLANSLLLTIGYYVRLYN